MPQRAVNLVLALAGVAAVVLIVVLGLDLARAANRGPRWKRRLVGAGILLLTSLGFAPAGCQEQMPTPSETAAALEAGGGEKAKADSTAAPEPAVEYREPQRKLAEEIMLADFAAARDQADEVVFGRPGYVLPEGHFELPLILFTEQDKKELLENLARSAGDVERLLKAGCLTESEAALMRHDIESLTPGIRAKAPVGSGENAATLVSPSAVAHHLADRLPFLEKLAAAKMIHLDPLWQLLLSTDDDVRLLGDDELKPLPEKERSEAVRIRKQAETLLEQIRTRTYAPESMPPDATLPPLVQLDVLTRKLEDFAKRSDQYNEWLDPVRETVVETHKQFDALKDEISKVNPESGNRMATDPLYDRSQAAMYKVYAMLADCFAKPEPIKAYTAQELRGQSLTETQAWKDLVSTWKEAVDIASGSRGEYPFYERRQSGLLANMQTAIENTDCMLEAGLLAQAEFDLLRLNMETLRVKLQGFRPKEGMHSSCYFTARARTAAETSVESLSERLPLLEKLAAENRVPQAVVETCLYSIENDLKVLGDEKEIKNLEPDKQAEARKARQAAEALVKKVRAGLAPQESQK
jgi:hypothetical protein